MKVLHLVGDHEDAGGVLSVIRNLQAVTPEGEMHHCVWVKEGYRESRQPALEYRYSQSVIAESTKHLRLFAQALPAYGDLKRLLQREPFDIIHAHSRGTLLVGMLAARFSETSCDLHKSQLRQTPWPLSMGSQTAQHSYGGSHSQHGQALRFE